MSKSSSSQLRDQRGASVSQLNWKNTFLAWYLHHYESALISLNKLMAKPVQSIMTWLVIAVALALPASLLIIVSNVNSLRENWGGDTQLTVYLRQSVSEQVITQTQTELKKIPEVMTVEYISPQQGLDELKKSGGFGDVLTSLKNNPLPPVYLIEPRAENELGLKMLAAQIESLSAVEFVRWDLEWVQRLQHITSLAERSVWLLGLFLSLGVLLTIGNTISLAIESRRDEISIIKLVGGTDAFVRRPLLYSGLWYGLMGGLLAWFLLAVARVVLSPVISDLLSSYGSEFSVAGAGFSSLLLLMLLGALLGLAGAWLAVARELKAIQPS